MSRAPSRRFIDKVVLITSASASIGVAVARGFEREGATVVLAALDLPSWRDPIEELRASDDGIELVIIDMADDAALRRLIDRTVALGGKLDVLVNDARLGEEVDLPEAEDEDLGVPVVLSRLALPHLAKAAGVIVDFASPAEPGSPGGSDAAIRAELRAIALVLAEALATTTVRVSTVEPDAKSSDLDALAERVLEGAAPRRAEASASSPRERRTPVQWHAAMVSAFSHDVNTPLGVLRTAGSVIADSVGDLLEDPPDDPDDIEELRSDLRNALDLLSRNLDRAQTIIQGFKHLAKLHLPSEQAVVELDRIIEECTAAARSELDRAGIGVRLDRREDDDYRWDGLPAHLAHGITELLHNAIRHAFAGREPGNITLELERPSADAFVIRVADDGNGMDPQLSSHIAEAAPHPTTGALALGLATTRFIVVRLLGGTLECDTAAGKGTTFTLTLPAVVTEGRKR
ncbi:MAG: SDR family NAD(P)-dependent oxidoreductase [Myxococcales bacterium]|nr:SDR family NAD(P)-dependent oxidoreductase [Myxococcales bacterium]